MGVYAWEQRIHQPLLLDITIPIDAQHCEDKLGNALDYALLCQQVTELVSSKTYQLIETVATEVAHFIKTQFAVSEVTVKVSKPTAIPNAKLVQISVHLNA